VTIAALRELDLGPAFSPSPFSIALPPSIFVDRVRRTKPLSERPIETRRVTFEHEPALPGPGAVVGEYRIDRAIGLGAIGAVYCAHHVARNTVVALKVIRPSLVADQPHAIDRIAEQARAAAWLDHDHVARIHGIVRSERFSYLVMDYVDGPDLSLLIERRGALPPKLVIRLLRHVTSALEAGLAERLVHRDLKPSNILLTSTGSTKVTDFGLSRATAAVHTTAYLAPEQLVDPTRACVRADIYSLGVTAYHALTGMLPMPDGHHVLSPDQLASAVPPALAELVVQMLATRPAERPADYAAIAGALRELPAW
jgi:serine/threonine protein kinase